MDHWVEARQLQVHFVSAAGLVYKEGRVLLIRSARRGWEIPGGVIEQGETVLDGLKREIFEESGVMAEPRCLAGMYQRLNAQPGFGPLRGMTLPPSVNLIFLCDYAGGTETVSDESLEVGWFTPEEAKEKVTAPHIGKALTELMQYSGKLYFGAFEKTDGGTMASVREDHIG